MENNKTNEIKTRSELIFFYDVIMANPNGDPLDENRPRLDIGTRKNLVSDVRLKRTIRDYLMNIGFNGEENSKGDIFVRELRKNNNSLQTGHERAEMFKSKEEILNRCIDIRLFGGVIPLGKKKDRKKKSGENGVEDEEKIDDNSSSIQLTGPIQFGIGSSIHEVDDFHIKGTGAFASSENKEQKTWRKEYILPYSFIGFEGVVNENNAKKTNLTSKDVNYLLEGMWEGTKNLITRSKFKHTPRIIIKINYKDKRYLGGLKDLFKLKLINPEMEEKNIRDLKDFRLDTTDFLNEIKSDKIESIEYLIDDKLKFVKEENEDINLIKELKNLLGEDKIKEIEYNNLNQ
jgi:CRISPR-associated protein Csh2